MPAVIVQFQKESMSEEKMLTESGLARRIKQHIHAKPQAFFAPCSPGFEPVLGAEVRALHGVVDVKVVEGGVEFGGAFELVYHANLRLRTAHRVLLRIESFTAAGYPELYNKAKRLPWERWVGLSRTVSFDVSSKTSRIHHTDHIAKAVHDAVKAVMNEQGVTIAHVPDAGLRIFVRLKDDQCTLSIDSSGENLHRRGWRIDTGHAPLRETLAAGLLAMAGVEKASSLVDICCGSGTFLVEAAQILRGIAPGMDRPYAFEIWPSFQEKTCAFIRRKLAEEARPASVPVRGIDIDAKALACAGRNIERAGLTADIILSEGDCRTFPLPAEGAHGGLIVGNLPYGKRVGEEKAVSALCAALGAHLRATASGWRYCLILGEDVHVHALGLQPEASLRFKNGGLPVIALMGIIPQAQK